MERDDLSLYQLKIDSMGNHVRDAKVIISHKEIGKSKQEEEIIPYDYLTGLYCIYCRVPNTYFFQVSKSHFHVETRQLHMKKAPTCSQTIDLTSNTYFKVKFLCQNLLTRHAISRAQVQISQLDEGHQVLGLSDEQGVFTGKINVPSEIRVSLVKEGFLDIYHDFKIDSKTCGNIFELFMLPSNQDFKQVGDFKVLVLQPH